MTPIDWINIGVCLLVALYGYAQGFIVGALSLAGFALGAFVGTRVAPLILSEGAHSPYAPLFGLAGALVAGAILPVGVEGGRRGGRGPRPAADPRLRRGRRRPWRGADRMRRVGGGLDRRGGRAAGARRGV